MVFLVDTVEVEPDRVDDYLAAVTTMGVPVMTDAGAALVSCRRSDPGTGAPGTVEVTWSIAGYEEWNEARRRLVLDPRWYQYGHAVAAMRLGGTRRFLQPAEPGSPEEDASGAAPL